MNPEEVDQVARIFVNLGATEPQARVMAAQLLKRADQLAAERGVDRVNTLEHLLKAAIAGREGRILDETDSTNGTTKPLGGEK